MKTKFIFFFLVVTTLSTAQIINFPDINLKNALLAATATGNSAGTGTVTDCSPQNYITIDANGDGEIQQSEALVVTYLGITGSSISNLSGIEYFTNLKCLSAGNNPITTLNLATLTELETLVVNYSQLTSINLTGLVSLKYLNCNVNQISNLDFSGLPNLEFVSCVNNLVSSLDFTANPLFEKLQCGYNPNLTSLKIKNGKIQQFSNSDACLFAGNPNLHYICADAAEIPILQSFQATCAVNNTCVINSACALGVEGFSINEVGVFPNPSTGTFNMSFLNPLVGKSEIAVYNVLGQKVYAETIDNKQEHTLQLSSLPSGTYILKIANNNKIVSKKIIKN